MYYKLTDQNMQTYNGFQWKLGRWESINRALRKRDYGLCSPYWFHCYNSPLLASLFNPIHAGIQSPRLFRCNVKGARRDDNGIKFGFTFMRLVEELALPEISVTQRVAFGILAATEACRTVQSHYQAQVPLVISAFVSGWQKWAADWLSGRDRSYYAATGAAKAAANAADYAANAADYAANAAASAAKAAKDAAYAAADYAADYAANAADYAANAAASAAKAAKLNLIAIARQAMKVR